ncbi:hypothetical protein A0H76_2615 [Hepatospora eriocheir]|uniref:Uncharacterized protein n=1 Tax=Hepatospora eriocheir TaxID=1081669 RepID=A0A1X0QF30_9MICR|nr:hypothetical protein A0H76_2615 [Hepatospora eriocheir]
MNDSSIENNENKFTINNDLKEGEEGKLNKQQEETDKITFKSESLSSKIMNARNRNKDVLGNKRPQNDKKKINRLSFCKRESIPSSQPDPNLKFNIMKSCNYEFPRNKGPIKYQIFHFYDTLKVIRKEIKNGFNIKKTLTIISSKILKPESEEYKSVSMHVKSYKPIPQVLDYNDNSDQYEFSNDIQSIDESIYNTESEEKDLVVNKEEDNLLDEANDSEEEVAFIKRNTQKPYFSTTDIPCETLLDPKLFINCSLFKCSMNSKIKKDILYFIKDKENIDTHFISNAFNVNEKDVKELFSVYD